MADMTNIHSGIDPNEMIKVQEIIKYVNEMVYNQLKTNCPQFKMRPTIEQALVLQGCVADGTKVGKPNEFDYLIPMDMSDDDWEIVETSSLMNALYHINKKRNKFNEKNVISDANSGKICYYTRNMNDQKIHELDYIVQQSNSEVMRSIEDDLCLERRISANKVYDACFRSIEELGKNVVPSSIRKSFFILLVSDLCGPAVTVHVEYKSDDSLDKFDCSLSIDYVPAMCIGGRYFVCTRNSPSNYYFNLPDSSDVRRFKKSLEYSLRYWRESFSFHELNRMKEIQANNPVLYEMYKSFKAFLAELSSWSYSGWSQAVNSSSEPHVDLQSHRGERIQKYFQTFSERSELDKLCSNCPMTNICHMLDLHSCHLKSVLFYLSDRKELQEADLRTLAAEYVTSLNDCINKRSIKIYFTGIEFSISWNNLIPENTPSQL